MPGLRTLLILVVLFTAGSCGGGEDIAGDALQEGKEMLSGHLADQYRDYSEDGDEDGDGSISPDEVDCSDHLFTRTEPLPSGFYPQNLVTPGTSYFECSDGDSRSIERYHADGSFESTIIGDYQDLLDFWEICEVGTRPPNASGNWVVTPDGQSCARIDILPGIILCSNSEVVEIIQYGRVIEYIDAPEADCQFRQQ